VEPPVGDLVPKDLEAKFIIFEIIEKTLAPDNQINLAGQGCAFVRVRFDSEVFAVVLKDAFDLKWDCATEELISALFESIQCFIENFASGAEPVVCPNQLSDSLNRSTLGDILLEAQIELVGIFLVNSFPFIKVGD
jgi:hypothetical protein